MRYPVECAFCNYDIEFAHLGIHLEEEHHNEFVDDFLEFVDNECEECNFCQHKMPRKALEGHEKRKHECEYCNNCTRLPKEFLQKHIDDKHALCVYCKKRMDKSQLEQHIEAKHRILVGSLFRSNNVTEKQMNQHIANNNVLVENGFIYLKN